MGSPPWQKFATYSNPKPTRMQFTGIVRFRTEGKPTGGAPSETEIHTLNPRREQRLCAATGWDQVEPGSLNLEVDRQVLKFLATLDPLEVEPASEVRYPDGWGHIPERREAYWYYAAVAEANGNKEAVLVRRPKGIPAGWRWVELFSAQRRLRDCLSVAQGDTITVRLTAG